MSLSNQRKKIKYYETGECFFEENKGIIANGSTKNPSYFRKPNSETYKLQKETRSVFIPENCDNIKPISIYLNFSELARFIE